MEDKQTLSVVIGRFQGPHKGHTHLIRKAAEAGDEVLVLVGSSFRPRSAKNPFTYKERAALLKAIADRENLGKPFFTLPLVDTLYDDDAWVTNVRIAVEKQLAGRKMNIRLVGFSKDRTSEYLRWFGGPGKDGWDSEPVDAHLHEGKMLNATELRETLFGVHRDIVEAQRRFGAGEVEAVRDLIMSNPEEFDKVREEMAFVQAYKARTAQAEAVYGFAIPINTVDAVVIQSGHVLLVERGAAPGKGLMALPGGHIERGETALVAAIRELVEETGLDIPKGVLRGRIAQKSGTLRNSDDTRVFDHPDRSERGWVRTQAFRWELEDRNTLEKVKGADDAVRAEWVPIQQIRPEMMFEDHFDIIQSMVPGVGLSYVALLEKGEY